MGAPPPPGFWDDDSTDVAAVASADFLAVWNAMREMGYPSKVQGQASGVDVRLLQRLCSPDANMQALWFRVSMLAVLDDVSPGWMDHSNRNKVAEVAATFPMEKLHPGTSREGFPFDLEEFLRQIAL